jgi:ABC-type nickel/cobalt efflux system permease component RcnA
MKSLVLLGFSGGIVPCPGALWLYFLSVSLHRTFEGILLITALGAGLATVLTAVGLLTVRVRRSVFPEGHGGEAWIVRRLPGLHGRIGIALDRALAWLGRSLGLIAPCIIAALGLGLGIWGLLWAAAAGGG